MKLFSQTKSPTHTDDFAIPPVNFRPFFSLELLRLPSTTNSSISVDIASISDDSGISFRPVASTPATVWPSFSFSHDSNLDSLTDFLSISCLSTTTATTILSNFFPATTTTIVLFSGHSVNKECWKKQLVKNRGGTHNYGSASFKNNALVAKVTLQTQHIADSGGNLNFIDWITLFENVLGGRRGHVRGITFHSGYKCSLPVVVTVTVTNAATNTGTY
ncbi:unnamed protein product [Lactuca virosa]|uniref:Uncharacterized protein n=1 Tax=Lactuca virosa TaxID=75947 RepID=A0AAU9NBJ9_9ASTR|nr:unnamed protein product [Lactuca virosa]